MAASSIDIHQPGKYPIVLSDALLGKTTKEVYTGLRYNYKPNVSSNSPSSSLRPSDSDSSSYDLSLKDNSNKYSYTGARTTGDGQYVLIFDPVKEHFVLHRIDSTFDMNLVSDPWTDDVSALRSEHPQLETETIQAPPPQRKASKGKKAIAAAKTEAPRKKITVPKKAKPPVREPSPEEEEESDDGFTVEDPDSAPTNQYHSQPVYQRQVSEEVSDEDEDAEHESYEEDEHNQDVDHLKLPSPATNAGGMSDEDFEADLEKELEAEFEEALKESHEADESSESEEE